MENTAKTPVPVTRSASDCEQHPSPISTSKNCVILPRSSHNRDNQKLSAPHSHSGISPGNLLPGNQISAIPSHQPFLVRETYRKPLPNHVPPRSYQNSRKRHTPIHRDLYTTACKRQQCRPDSLPLFPPGSRPFSRLTRSYPSTDLFVLPSACPAHFSTSSTTPFPVPHLPTYLVWHLQNLHTAFPDKNTFHTPNGIIQ